jgi:hypothetical protein
MADSLNPAVMQHLIEAMQHNVLALNSPLPKNFIIDRLNRDLRDMRAEVGYDLAQVVSAQDKPAVLTGEAAEFAEKIAKVQNG